MKIVFASNNKNKITEIQSVLPPNISIIGLEEIGCFEEIPETADTIEGNAILKANYVTEKYGFDCFADDSGLEVDALNGAPGVYSARYAGVRDDAEANMKKLLGALESEINRSAQFKTVIALNVNGEQYLFSGTVKGEITLSKSGSQGFGYDPIFKANGMSKSFAELTIAEKSDISHRSIAVKKLLKFLTDTKQFNS